MDSLEESAFREQLFGLTSWDMTYVTKIPLRTAPADSKVNIQGKLMFNLMFVPLSSAHLPSIVCGSVFRFEFSFNSQSNVFFSLETLIR